jgi:hypothetical protein
MTGTSVIDQKKEEPSKGTDELASLLQNLSLGGDVGEQLHAFLVENEINLSRNKVKKLVKTKVQNFRCATCRAYYDHYKELRSHLTVERGHIVDRDLIKGSLVAFKKRIVDKYGTPFDGTKIDSYTRAEVATFVGCLVDIAYMIKLR